MSVIDLRARLARLRNVTQLRPAPTVHVLPAQTFVRGIDPADLPNLTRIPAQAPMPDEEIEAVAQVIGLVDRLSIPRHLRCYYCPEQGTVQEQLDNGASRWACRDCAHGPVTFGPDGGGAA